MRKVKINLQKIEEQKMKAQKRKRCLRIGIVSAIIVLCLVLTGIVCYRKYQQQQQLESLRGRYMNWEACSTDLTVLVDFLLEKYPDPAQRPESLTVYNGELLDPDGKYLFVPSGINTTVKNIEKNAYDDINMRWRQITFHGNRIQFNNISNYYALVYSPDGAPTFLHEEGEGYELLIEHIEGNWYHVTRIS